MYSLFIDTHGEFVNIVLYKDGLVLEEIHEESKNKHSEITMLRIKEILSNCGLIAKDLSEIIVVNGPGSFTGERLAVTIAKTFAYALHVPIKVVDSLTIMALSLNNEKENIVAIEERNGAFVGVFDDFNTPQITYMGKTEYEELKKNHSIFQDVRVDYNKVYSYLIDKPVLNVHEVKPLYVKGIKVLDGK